MTLSLSKFTVNLQLISKVEYYECLRKTGFVS